MWLMLLKIPNYNGGKHSLFDENSEFCCTKCWYIQYYNDKWDVTLLWSVYRTVL